MESKSAGSGQGCVPSLHLFWGNLHSHCKPLCSQFFCLQLSKPLGLCGGVYLSCPFPSPTLTLLAPSCLHRLCAVSSRGGQPALLWATPAGPAACSSMAGFMFVERVNEWSVFTELVLVCVFCKSSHYGFEGTCHTIEPFGFQVHCELSRGCQETGRRGRAACLQSAGPQGGGRLLC